MVEEHKDTQRTRVWSVLPLILLLSLIEPALHYWVWYWPPEGARPTGAHTGDSAHHILCLRALDNGFFSPFARDESHSTRHFCVPFFLLYAVLGQLRHVLGMHEFLFLGWLNGFGGGLLLATAYVFFRTVAPRRATRALYVLVFGGGIGGLLYLFALNSGWTDQPRFEEAFLRFAAYELIEGQAASPVLLMPRFYYTFPMALALVSLALLVHADRAERTRMLRWSGVLVSIASFINVRIGPMAWLAAMLYLGVAGESPTRERTRAFLHYTLSVAVACALSYGVMTFHPVYLQNVSQVTQSCMWLLSFVTATAWCWPAVPKGTAAALRGLSRPWRLFAWGLLGYVGAYTLLYLAHQAFYGNWLRGGDTSAAVAVSDWALLGILPGFLWGRRTPLDPPNAPVTRSMRESGWIALWFLLFLALAVSAFGRGWFLRLSPQRFMVFLGIPLALLTAHGLELLRLRVRRCIFTALVACGSLSVLVGSLFFQGPLWFPGGDSPFAYLRYESISETNAALIDALPPGAVVIVQPWCPISLAEIVALRGDVKVVGGAGAMNLGDQPFGPLENQIRLFFGRPTPEAKRACLDLVRDWNIEYVFVADKTAFYGKTAFREYLDIEIIAGRDESWLYRIRSRARE